MENRHIGSLRCRCCDVELQDWEDEYCEICKDESDLEELYQEYLEIE